MNRIATVIHTKHLNGTIPQILLLNQESAVLCKTNYLYNQALLNKGLSYATVRESTSAIALLYDYYYLVHKASNPNPYKDYNFIYNLLQARLKGSVLDWNNLSNKVAIKQITHLERFCSWLKYHSHYDETDLTTLLKKSYDFYLTKEPIKYDKQGLQEHSKFLKSFPEDKLQAFLNAVDNPSYKICYLLMLNGRRLSEILNMFASDIQVYNNELRAYVAHPESSYYKWKGKEGTREEYLKEVFNLTPRTKIGSGALVAGWKGIKFADPIKKVSQIHFILETDKLLLKHYTDYVLKTRKHINNHPYLLVDANGNPLNSKRVLAHFKATCKKIGVESSREIGTTTLGLRTFYCRYCHDLKISPVMITQLISSTKNSSNLRYEKESLTIQLIKGLTWKK